MTIEDELSAFLQENIKEHASIDKKRNIEIITYFYGFRESPWPTLDETADQFSVGTRERIRQIIKNQFRDAVNASDIPTIKLLREVVDSNRYWLQSELETKIVDLGLAGDNFSVRGLFNLLNDVGSNIAYDVYTPDLQTVTRTSLGKFNDHFIIRKIDVKEIKSLFNKVKKLPGRCGIARLDYLKGDKDYSAYVGLIESLIRLSESSWTKYEKGSLWYLFENHDNTLINFSRKVFSFLDKCDAVNLSETYHNALHGRSHVYEYPPVELIIEYLRSSRHLENIDDTLTFTGQVTHLNDIERDAAEYLGSKGSATYPELLAHLKSKGYKKPTADKTVYRSPFIYTDKSLGRGQYKYSLVGSLKVAADKSVEEDRYKQFLRRLRRIGDTDETVEQRIRKEQTILREWLFEGKDQENCAICRHRYTVQALVAAHKKKRRDCNPAERLDPYIVMPVCVFGCDFLYENRHVVVKDSVVTNGLPLDNADVENKYIQKLIGKEVAEEWLKGQASYFHTPELPQ